MALGVFTVSHARGHVPSPGPSRGSGEVYRMTPLLRRRFEDDRYQQHASEVARFLKTWTSGNLPGHAERKLAFVYALRGGGLLPCGESLIVGPGFACLCLSHDTCML
jgi:hypothetical protein